MKQKTYLLCMACEKYTIFRQVLWYHAKFRMRGEGFYKSGLTVDQHFLALARQLLLTSQSKEELSNNSGIQGWQRKLDPEYNVMETLKALLLKADWVESFFYTIEGLVAP